ncbi:hypothetical protein BU24DRAFT_101186 [Aaosphaeria arxii CBS 175.79]|uniref:Uncharacterized protein n=1 Tax=Aaosphaeria arxii CBS 175.79 TaxID=1450172 RepID=A0A6A5XZ88_9PLEO|nr:uncharacterized protein BU24DRAFT_101186 [Aaosphaeria arxii CBS 175.79]KAF2018635.1 hypothetical protein BU24DRAFT_101186 [Aaosphaeria arxii CBS 175.79]
MRIREKRYVSISRGYLYINRDPTSQCLLHIFHPQPLNPSLNLPSPRSLLNPHNHLLLPLSLLILPATANPLPPPLPLKRRQLHRIPTLLRPPHPLNLRLPLPPLDIRIPRLAAETTALPPAPAEEPHPGGRDREGDEQAKDERADERDGDGPEVLLFVEGLCLEGGVGVGAGEDMAVGEWHVVIKLLEYVYVCVLRFHSE